MPELTARNISFMTLMAATALIRIIAPDSQQAAPDVTNMQRAQTQIQGGMIDLNLASVELLDTLP